jgi:threonine synthase
MRFVSTRGGTAPVGFSEAVALGLAPDGGLFLPAELPDLTPRWPGWESLAYPDLAYEFMRLFATDVPPVELRAMVTAAYRHFDHPDTAPLRRLGGRLWVLELFHGPTLAFKDFALQLLGQLYARQCRERGERLTVLGATSGDTGAAAIHGLLAHDCARLFILYPEGRVSPLQERQMACTGSENVFALAIAGTFDDAQAALKAIFADREFAARHRLSAVNSINLARVLAQCVYYLYAWLRLPADARAGLEFIVPTGNFGNVLAGWLLRRMGVPIDRFCVATNRNDILWRLFETGDYAAGSVEPSLAPSMDIQVASNFERFLFYLLGGDTARVSATMATFARERRVHLAGLSAAGFRATRTDDAEILERIREVHGTYGYVIDPHTACGFKDLPRDRSAVVLATAHPAKFPDAIHRAIGGTARHPALDALAQRAVVKHHLPADEAAIRAFLDRHA